MQKISSAPVSENWASKKPKPEVIEMTVPILSGCLDFGGRSGAMLTQKGINCPEGYTTNDAKPWLGNVISCHPRKTKRRYGVTWGKHNTLYILSTV